MVTGHQQLQISQWDRRDIGVRRMQDRGEYVMRASIHLVTNGWFVEGCIQWDRLFTTGIMFHRLVHSVNGLDWL
jgi:hypothetical protein